MKPILFSIGNVQIVSFGAMIGIGIITALLLALVRARRDGFPKVNTLYDLTLIFIVTGFLGGRLYYVLQYADWYSKHPGRILAFWEGGLTFYGGLVAGFLGGVLYFKLKKLPVLKMGDFSMPFIALFHAISRIGCFLNGCCGGKKCPLEPPWCLKFPGTFFAVYPTQLYEAFFDFGLFLFLYLYYERKKFDGQIFMLYFILYAAARFVIEFWRDNPSWMHLTHNQWVSIALFLVSVFFYFRLKKKSLSV
jgi:phosphatidylglycerol:prolipoprotein diacylglycerol transferase